MIFVDLSGGDPSKLLDRAKACTKYLEKGGELNIFVNQEKRILFPRKWNYSVDSLNSCLQELRSDPRNILVTAGDTVVLAKNCQRYLKRIARVQPVLFGEFPNATGHYWFGDIGGGTDNSLKQLLWTAYAGKCIGELYFGITPKIGLLNIGEEKNKGGKELYSYNIALLDVLDGAYRGNVEPHNLYKQDIEVVIAPGNYGNVALKAAEGVTELIKAKVQNYADTHGLEGIAMALIYKMSSKIVLDDLNWKKRAGALFLGFNQTIVKTHGRSEYVAFNSALELAGSPIAGSIQEYLVQNIGEYESWLNKFEIETTTS